ncbi:GDYXXLXY domain-containing protein [Neptuniibacter sp. QD72_48]|uniref:GDYXXLXY domain-containing protein n=1 Tax=unclassified Neptuniibacter TaxID=2630693 RepID=UPI0039F477FE
MTNSDQALWQKLQTEGIVTADQPEEHPSQSAWFIHLMQGFSGWLAALFMLGFVGSIFGWLFRYDNHILLMVAGLGCSIGAYTIYRHSGESPFYNQLALAISICGQFMFGWGLFEFLGDNEVTVFLALAIYQAVLALVMPSFLHRVISSWFAMIALFWGLNRQGIHGLDSAVAALAFTLIWCKEQQWLKWHKFLIPISYGMAISLLQFSGHSLLQNELSFLYKISDVGFLQLNGPLIGSIAQIATFAFLLAYIFKEQQVTKDSKNIAGYLALIIIMAVTSFTIAGLPAALLLLLVGFHRQQRALLGLGLVALISFVSWYYYNLQETLLVKSIYLVGLGTVALVSYFLLSKIYLPDEKMGLSHAAHMNRAKWSALITAFLLLIAVNINIYQKETLLAEGKTVLLELAPVDPRSLMQGDYMRLRFQITNEAFNRSLNDVPADGFLLVELDENHKASFLQLLTRSEKDKELASNQAILQYRIRNSRVQFATNAFFFQEGTAERYEAAKYGMFKTDDSGELLLYALVDESLDVIGTNSP